MNEHLKAEAGGSAKGGLNVFYYSPTAGCFVRRAFSSLLTSVASARVYARFAGDFALVCFARFIPPRVHVTNSPAKQKKASSSIVKSEKNCLGGTVCVVCPPDRYEERIEPGLWSTGEWIRGGITGVKRF